MESADHLFVQPDAHFQRVILKVRENVKLHGLAQRYMGHLNLLAHKADLAVPIHDARGA